MPTAAILSRPRSTWRPRIAPDRTQQRDDELGRRHGGRQHGRTKAVHGRDAARHLCKETSSHLTEIREYLRKRTGQPAPHDLPESVYRAIHTLSGSSKMAEARHGIRITEPLNHVMRKVFDSGQGLSDAGLATLEQSVRAIENVLSHINESTGFFSDQPALLARFRDLEAEVDAMIASAARDTSASAMVPALKAAPAPPRPPTAPPRSPPRGRIRSRNSEHLQRGGNRIAGSRSRLADGLEPGPKDKQPVAELQRQLHTLKGGARMAGVTAMGDLSHELETLVLQIDSGSVAGDDHAHAVMQASLDELSRMRDLVSAGTLPGEARDLIARIRGLGHQPAVAQPSAAPAAAGAPAAPPAPTAPSAASPTAAIARRLRPWRRSHRPRGQPRWSLRRARPRRARTPRRAWN